jgi:hypothetical protein
VVVRLDSNEDESAPDMPRVEVAVRFPRWKVPFWISEYQFDLIALNSSQSHLLQHVVAEVGHSRLCGGWLDYAQ